MITLSIRRLVDPYYNGFAAQVAFYFLMSIVPTVIVLSQLLGFFSISLSALDDLINQYVAKDAADILLRLLRHQSTGAMNFFFIALALWASSRAEFSLMRIANYTMSGGETTGNGYFRDRIRACKTMALTLFTLTFGLIILVYGEIIIKIVAAALLTTLKINLEVSVFWLVLRWPVTLLLYFFMVSYSYYILPSVKVTFRQVLPGSLFSSVGMLAVTLIYKYYAEYMAQMDLIYGSLAAIVAVMFWFYLLAWALVLGIMCNKVWEDTRGVE